MADNFQVIKTFRELDEDLIQLKENGKMLDICYNDKRLWFRWESSLRSGYSLSFNKAYVSFTLTRPQQKQVECIDTKVLNYISNTKLKMFHILRQTPRTMESLFRSSIYEGSLRCTFPTKECCIFDNEGKLLDIEDHALPTVLSSGTKMTVAIEPSIVWYFNKMIGIQWNVRQVKLEKVPDLSIVPPQDNAANYTFSDDD